MGKFKSLEIVYNSPMAVYYPGQIVQGTVVLELNEPLEMRGIKVKFSGKANVHWTETYSTGKGTFTVPYNAEESYFDAKTWVLGKDKDRLQLPAGRHTYNFQFTLPPALPSSYESEIGQVRYYCKAIVDIPLWFDHTCKCAFTVVSLLDLNANPQAVKEGRMTNQKHLCCLCCKSGPISATLSLPRVGYVPGESIQMYGEIENLSNREIKKTVLELVQEVKYHATTKTKTERHLLGMQTRGVIRPGGHDQWNGERQLVPAVPPAFLELCKIIEIHYYLVLKVVPKGVSLDLNCPVELVIGSIPLRQVVQDHPPLAPSAFAPAGGDPSKDQLYGAGPSVFSLPPPPSMPPNIPPPGYSESFFGKQNVFDDDDEHDIGGHKTYAPIYPYYIWGNQ